MWFKVGILVEKIMLLVMACAIICGIILVTRERSHRRPPDSLPLILYGLVCFCGAGLVFVVWLTLCSWRINLCSCKKPAVNEDAESRELETHAKSLLLLLQDSEVVNWIHCDPDCGPKFQEILATIQYSNIMKFENQQGLHPDGVSQTDDPWKPQYPSEQK